jgi:hypothetical protein
VSGSRGGGDASPNNMSRWSGMNVFAGNSLTPNTPYWKIKDYPMMRNTSQVSYYKLIH